MAECFAEKSRWLFDWTGLSGTNMWNALWRQVKVSSYIAQYPVFRTVQSALHFTSLTLTDLFTQTPSRLLWEASSHLLQLMREGCSYTYPPLSIARYSFIQLSELEQCRVKKLAQNFNTAAQDSNPGSHSRESESLPLSHCTLLCSRKNWLQHYRKHFLLCVFSSFLSCAWRFSPSDWEETTELVCHCGSECKVRVQGHWCPPACRHMVQR